MPCHKGTIFRSLETCALGEVGGHVGEDVDAHQVGQAEGAGAGPADGLTGEGVHLFDGQALLPHQARGGKHDGDADAVGDEVGGVAGRNHLLAQEAVGEGGEGGQHGGVGFRGWDHFQQAHVARRIEEVGAEEAVAVTGEAGGDLRNGQAGGIGGEHGVGRKVGCHARQQGRLDVQILRHGFDHPVALGQPGQVVLKVAGGEEGGERRLIEGGRPGFGEGLDGAFGKAAAVAFAGRDKVEQKGGNAGVGQVGGDAAAHGSRAQHGGAAHQQRLGGKGGSGRCGRGSGAHASSPCADWSEERSTTRKPWQHTEERGTGSRMPADWLARPPVMPVSRMPGFKIETGNARRFCNSGGDRAPESFTIRASHDNNSQQERAKRSG